MALTELRCNISPLPRNRLTNRGTFVELSRQLEIIPPRPRPLEGPEADEGREFDPIVNELVILSCLDDLKGKKPDKRASQSRMRTEVTTRRL